jgi:hypothetical protein
MRDDWQSVGDRNFPGGRQTVDETAKRGPSGKEPAVPAAAFAA